MLGVAKLGCQRRCWADRQLVRRVSFNAPLCVPTSFTSAPATSTCVRHFSFGGHRAGHVKVLLESGKREYMCVVRARDEGAEWEVDRPDPSFLAYHTSVLNFQSTFYPRGFPTHIDMDVGFGHLLAGLVTGLRNEKSRDMRLPAITSTNISARDTWTQPRCGEAKEYMTRWSPFAT
jgi:hypothetical protein